MADRTNARLFAVLFEALASETSGWDENDWNDANDVRTIAATLLGLSQAYDFSTYQMFCDDALVALGLARQRVYRADRDNPMPPDPFGIGVSYEDGDLMDDYDYIQVPLVQPTHAPDVEFFRPSIAPKAQPVNFAIRISEDSEEAEADPFEQLIENIREARREILARGVREAQVYVSVIETDALGGTEITEFSS